MLGASVQGLAEQPGWLVVPGAVRNRQVDRVAGIPYPGPECSVQGVAMGV